MPALAFTTVWGYPGNGKHPSDTAEQESPAKRLKTEGSSSFTPNDMGIEVETKVLKEDTVNAADIFFNMPTDGPITRITSFLDPIDIDTFLQVNKNLRKKKDYKNKAFRIPWDMPSDELRLLLPALKLVEKITIGVTFEHLEILAECTKLRHLVVEEIVILPPEEEREEGMKEELDGDVESDGESVGSDESDGEPREETELELRAKSFLELLSTFIDLTTLKIAFTNHHAMFNIGFVAPLVQLISLDVSGIWIDELDTLVELKKLVYLDLSDTVVSDLTNLTGLDQLRHLNISAAYISDITPLAALTGLTHLNVSKNEVGDLTAISYMKNLAEFVMMGLYDVPLPDLSPFTELFHSTKLDLSYTDITDPNGLESLSGLTELKSLSLNCSTDSQLTDFSPLRGMTLLEEIYLSGVACTDISFTSDMSLLKILDIQWSQIDNIAECANMEFLEWLEISSYVEDLIPLYGLKHLTHLDIWDRRRFEQEAIDGLPSNTVLCYYYGSEDDDW
jgi:internalin A